ncbi:MAG: peptidoglycan DD-metalloendopeptidase family protein [Alphaproteobacteria bacterium]|nr:peptidoglycan DD-metalloendopeptidase family protein [Alphaproteobacteria bacterium]
MTFSSSSFPRKRESIAACLHGIRFLPHAAHKVLASFVLIAVLSACTFTRPPEPHLPNRSGIQIGETITVKQGENVYSIAQDHNVSMREVIVLNDLKPPFEVRRGQSLMLPAGGSSFSGDLPPPTAAPMAPVEKTNLAPIMPPSVSSQEITPPVFSAPTNTAPASAPQSSAPGMFGAQSSVVAEPPSQPTSIKQPAEEIPESAALTAPEIPSSSLKWPVQGPILSTFGPKGSGMNNDGINISAPKGSPVVAAAPGTVVYAGNDMKGFGNLVLIKHQGDLVTAYAHLDRVLVKRDALVTQSDTIGTVGKTGNVPSPQLHFEVRQSGKPVNPQQVIKNAP